MSHITDILLSFNDIADGLMKTESTVRNGMKLVCDTSPVTAKHCKDFELQYNREDDCWVKGQITVGLDDMATFKHVAFRNPTVQQLVLMLLLAETVKKP